MKKAKYTLPIMAATAVMATPILAYATVVDFSFTGGSGGTVTGVLDFSGDTGVQTPTKIEITGVPSKFIAIPAPFTFPAAAIVNGHFTFSQGNIVGGNLLAHTNLNKHANGTTFIGLSLLGEAGGRNDLASGLFAAGTIYVISTSNSAGLKGMTFTTQGAAFAPEPASVALLGAGLAGLASFRRRARA